MAAGGATGRARVWERPHVVVAARDAGLTLVGLVAAVWAVLGGEPALIALAAGALGLPVVLRADECSREGARAVELYEEFVAYRDAHGRTFRR